jgi:transglutaminase-like putative cysteine protease
MRRLLGVFVGVLCVLAPARASETVLREHWYTSHTDQGRVGSLHLKAVAVEQDGKKLIRTTQREELTYLRSGEPYTERFEQYTLETADGEVVEVGYTTFLSPRQRLSVRGEVSGDRLTLRVLSKDGTPTEFSQRKPWDSSARGLYALDTFFVDKPWQLGTPYTVKVFSPIAHRVVPVTFTLTKVEPVRIGGEDRKLLRVEQTHPAEFALDNATLWLDDEGTVVKIREDVAVFGSITYERTTEAVAAARFRPRASDAESPFTVDRPIRFRHGMPKELRVRVSVAGDERPATLFAEDGRQTIVRADRFGVELRLLAAAEDHPQPGPVSPEYLASNFFIRSDDPLVRKLAREAVGGETDPRKQLPLIRQFLKKRFTVAYNVSFATADEVARHPEGDCSELGVLAAAMCRSLGIPARVVFGLVYDPTRECFGGHLWTEVYLGGRWEPFDPTGVLDPLNAAYLKIAAYSLAGVLNPDELPEIRRAYSGRMYIRILESK